MAKKPIYHSRLNNLPGKKKSTESQKKKKNSHLSFNNYYSSVNKDDIIRYAIYILVPLVIAVWIILFIRSCNNCGTQPATKKNKKQTVLQDKQYTSNNEKDETLNDNDKTDAIKSQKTPKEKTTRRKKKHIKKTNRKTSKTNKVQIKTDQPQIQKKPEYTGPPDFGTKIEVITPKKVK